MARVVLVFQDVIFCKKSILFLLVAIYHFGWIGWSAGRILHWSVWPMYTVCGNYVGAFSILQLSRRI